MMAHEKPSEQFYKDFRYLIQRYREKLVEHEQALYEIESNDDLNSMVEVKAAVKANIENYKEFIKALENLNTTDVLIPR